jgi:ABC-2 type transport system permease protein
MSFAPATMPWFAAHEGRLMWRDGIAMMTGGHPTRRTALIVILVIAAGLLHLMANAIVSPWVADGVVPDKPTLVLITGTGFLFWTVMLSQALESITRVYYSRSDLDLILSSPSSSRTLFAVRTGITAVTTLVLACLLASPIIDVLVFHDGAQWLMAYLVLAALSALATAIAVLITIGLFRVPDRWAEADAADRADHCRDRRRRFRHRHPGSRHPSLRQHVALRAVCRPGCRRGGARS